MSADVDNLIFDLEREGNVVSARAVRAVQRLYRGLRLVDLLKLIEEAASGASATARTAAETRLMAAFDAAVANLAEPPAAVLGSLRDAVLLGTANSAAVLNAQAGIVDMFRVDPILEREYTKGATARFATFWAKESKRFRGEVQTALLEGLKSGQSSEQIARRLRERVNVSRSRATLIARNETGNASAYAAREWQQAVGVTEYVWRTASDNRVRPEHAARNGEVFRWDDPPEDGHPGQAIQCRCVAQAVLPEPP